MSAFQSIQQNPDKALQTYNTRYESYYQLAHPDLDIDNDASRVSCIHYANSLHGKLGDEMEGRFNQELPDNLWAAFKKAVNFKPRVLTKQCINTRRVNEVNHIDVSSDYEESEVNKVHVRNPNYKGKNYNPNYNSRGNLNNAKNDYTEKPVNIQVTLTGPMNKDQLFKIQEVLRNPRIYRDKLPKGQQHR